MEKIILTGSPEDIGFQHGKMLGDKIHRNIAFYRDIFLGNLESETQVLELAASFKKRIEAFNPNYVTEIDHIAKGAGISEPLWLYALNSRTELAITEFANECTAVAFPRHNIIGQTWDWAQHLETHSVIMEIIFPSGDKILQLTEAGIIGKTGLNNKGLGLTLNLLRVENQKLTGVPVHILMRAVLESRNLEGANGIINRSRHGRASNFILSQSGRAINVEFSAGETNFHQIRGEAYAHTNHYLHTQKSAQIAEMSYADSLGRYVRAREMLNSLKEFSASEMISILSDQSNREHSILSNHEPHPIKAMGNCGTLATIIMDLENRTMKVRKGNPKSASFSIEDFKVYSI
jgi:isopenicillin-N N-acyltransferase-like protein